MIWTRKPRLYSAVATVAVETVLSLLRVASLSFDMVLALSSFRGASKMRTTMCNCTSEKLEIPRCAIAHLRSGPSDHPGMTVQLINRRLAHRRAEGGFEEIEIAAFVGLLDVPCKHPAIAALEAPLRLLPIGAALFQFRLADVEIDAARGDVERNLVAVLHQRKRHADEGFRRHMQDAGAIADAAHARIRQPHHVAHALL